MKYVTLKARLAETNLRLLNYLNCMYYGKNYQKLFAPSLSYQIATSNINMLLIKNFTVSSLPASESALRLSDKFILFLF